MYRLSILALTIYASLATYGQLFTPLGLGIEKCKDQSRPQMHVEGDILYVCTNQGLYSKDLSSEGSKWQLAGFKGIPLQDYVRREDDIIALRYNVNNSYFLLSHDGGMTYEDITPDLFKEKTNNVLPDLIQRPNDPNSLLVSSTLMGLFQTTDFGQTWNQLTGIRAEFIGYHPLNPEVIYGSGQDGVYSPYLNISYDGGQTWNYSPPYYPGDNYVSRMAFHPTDPNRWIGGGIMAVYTSADNGHTWDTQILSDAPFRTAWRYTIYDVENSDIVYMAGADKDKIEVMCSTDGGKSWNVPQTEPMKEHSEKVYDFKQYGGKLLFYTESDVYQISKAELLAQTSSVLTISTTKGESSETFDLQGRKQVSKPTECIYIQQGRKLVVK